MSIAKAQIGNALESVAPDHVVTTADQIYDEALGKYQSEINQECGGGYNPPVGGIPKTDLASDVQASLTKADNDVPNTRKVNGKALSADINLGAGDVDAYTKTEVNNLLVNAPETSVVVIDNPSGADPTTLLPSPAAPNTIYRVKSADGTYFSEYEHNGTKYVNLADREYGIDNEPTQDSDYFVKSSGIRGYIAKFQRCLIHKPYDGTADSDLTKYDIYTFKPNAIYRIIPSFSQYPEVVDSSWIMAIVSYSNNVSSIIRQLFITQNKKATDIFFKTPSTFDYIRIGLRGVPFYSVEVEEVTEDIKEFTINHDSGVDYPVIYPAMGGDKIKISIKSVLETGYIPTNDAISIGCFVKNSPTSEIIEFTKLNAIMSIANVVEVELPNNTENLFIKPLLDTSFVSEIKIEKKYYDENIPYVEDNILPIFSRLDSNEVLNVAPSNNFWGAFHVAAAVKQDNVVKVSFEKVISEDAAWPGIRKNQQFVIGNKVNIKFKYKSVNKLYVVLGSNILYPINPSGDWASAELNDIEVTNAFDRIQVSVRRADIPDDGYFYISDFEVTYSNVGSIQENIRKLKNDTKDIDVIYNSIFNNVLDPEEVIDNSAVRQNGTLNDDASAFQIWKYRVTPGTTYKFSGNMTGLYDSYFINWFNGNDFIGHEYQASYGENVYTNVSIIAPPNATHLLLNVAKEWSNYYSVKGIGSGGGGSSIINNYKGKKISILGDSISTAVDNNAVSFKVLESDISNSRTLQGYPTNYDIGKSIGNKVVTVDMVGVLTSFTPINGDLNKTIGQPLNYNSLTQDKLWWKIMADTIKAEILQNVSWSGASISSHEGDKADYKGSYAWHDSQISKLADRNNNNERIVPDVVIIYRGTNDFSHTPYTKLSNFGANATSIPNTDTITDGIGFKEAYAITIKKIRETYPRAEVICCTLNVFKRVVYDHFPTRNGINTLPEYNNAIREIADMMGCKVIEFDKDGITFENCYPTYISDDATIPTHPNVFGHQKMAEKAIIDILK